MPLASVVTIGTGKPGDPVRPDLPVGISWSGTVGKDGLYLVLTKAPLTDSAKVATALTPVAVDTVIATKGLAPDDVARWAVA